MWIGLPLTQNSGQSANGSFQFFFDGQVRTLQFDARKHTVGSASGQMTFDGVVDLPGDDVDGDGSGGPGGLQNAHMKVSFDCVRVSGNRTAMSGLVTSRRARRPPRHPRGRRQRRGREDRGAGPVHVGPLPG